MVRGLRNTEILWVLGSVEFVSQLKQRGLIYWFEDYKEEVKETSQCGCLH